MDSKVMRLAMAVFVALIALILIIVYASNADKINSFLKGSAIDSSNGSVAELSAAQNGQIGNNLHGFMAQTDFFDEPDNLASIYSTDVTALTMEIKPGEGQIQISIKNGRGGLETGEKFAVTVTNMDNEDDENVYIDEDRNGQILIEDLEIGSYEVTLNEKEGYHVPSNGIVVRVTKESVDIIEINGTRAGVSAEEGSGYGSSSAGSGTSTNSSGTAGPSGDNVAPTPTSPDGTTPNTTNDAGLDSSASSMRAGTLENN
jgi:hypothetical protein